MKFYFGVDYYPEHWPREQWETYAAQMREAHFNVVRLAEFAWVLMEPSEGQYEFGWLDDALAGLHREGLKAILGTPTAVMPAWVKQKYPETLASADGRHRDAWGVRKNNCFSSGTYRLLSVRITLAMAEHYVGHPAVIGWQTDNELDGPICRCDSCKNEFHVFLQQQYADIDTLNRAWGTHFWGHRFSAWDQIPVPTNDHADNPSACLDWRRFATWLQVRFQRDQVRLLRRLCPDHFITHNFMGFGNNSNCYDLAHDLDLVAFDSYPDFPTNDAHGMPYGTAASCDMTRGLKAKNFLIMETTAGPAGWGMFGGNPRPGAIRKTFYQHVAHGADGQLFFRWRTCTAGREQYWHGLLGHDGKTGRRYLEASEIGREAQLLAGYLDGTTLRPQVCLIYDYDSRWATEIQPGFSDNNYVGRLMRYYCALLRAGVNVDIVPASVGFSAYKVVIAPQLHVLGDEIAIRLNEYVHGGGVLVTDARTAVKTQTNLCHERTLPGLLAESLGITIEEYGAGIVEFKVSGNGRVAGQFTAQGYADCVSATGAEVLARYEPWHMAQYAALTRFKTDHGGTGYYVGTVVREDAFYDALVADVLVTAGITPLVTPPPGVEVSIREGPHHSLLFLINHTEEPQHVTVPMGLRDVLSGRTTGDTLELGRFGVSVLVQETNRR